MLANRAVGTNEWNHMKLGAENGRHNMMVYEGLVRHSHGANSCFIVIPDDMELKQRLMHANHDSPILSHLGV